MRFEPDTLSQALLRYFDMVAPDANVYIEIPAPDLRFAAIAFLAAAAALCWRKLPPGRAPVLALALLVFASTAVWLATSGNGRYFMAVLVCAGPLAVALVCMLPLTRAFRGALALLLVLGQGFLLTQQTPWSAWTVLQWDRAPYFGVALGPQELQGPPTTYASMSLLTYSLIAPQFPPQTRWINLHAGSATSRDEQHTLDFLRQAALQGPVKLIAPAVPNATLPDGLPTPAMVTALDKLAGQRNLRISGACRHIPSEGLAAMAELQKRDATPDAPPGFWTCPVVYEVRARDATPTPVPDAVRAAYRQVGAACPRFFPPEQAAAPSRLVDGWMVRYGSQTHLYVMDNQEVWYQFWRNFTPVRVGTVSDVLAGRAQVNCGAVRNDGAWRTGAQ